MGKIFAMVISVIKQIISGPYFLPISPTNDKFLKPKNCCDIIKKIRYPRVDPKLGYSQRLSKNPKSEILMPVSY
jgi:hypothetical protein